MIKSTFKFSGTNLHENYSQSGYHIEFTCSFSKIIHAELKISVGGSVQPQVILIINHAGNHCPTGQAQILTNNGCPVSIW